MRFLGSDRGHFIFFGTPISASTLGIKIEQLSKKSMDDKIPPAPEDTAASTPKVPDQVVASVTPTPAVTEPDEIQPFLDKAKETIKHELEEPELDNFLRAHIKTLREEWADWSDSAKVAYTHMMTAQLLQRKAADTQIGLGHEFKLPAQSAQMQLMESLKYTQKKPKKRQPVLSMPPNLRPISSPKK